MKDTIRTLKELLKIGIEERRELQRHGVNVVPANFYSTVPSVDEIESSFEYTSPDAPYDDPLLFPADAMRATLSTLLPFCEEFDPPQDGNEPDPDGFFWRNTMYSHADAMSYYCFVRSLAPRSIVEVGSGFSTMVAAMARDRNGSGAIHCIEPYPPKWLARRHDITLHAVKAQEIRVEFLNDILADGDILFIDSTHTVKAGSDCLHLYLRMLPRIRRDIHVHVHDVFLPWALPKSWLFDHQFYWTEQYLLLAFLTDNPKAQVIYGSHCNSQREPALMQALMRGRAATAGGSLWFRYEGTKAVR